MNCLYVLVQNATGLDTFAGSLKEMKGRLRATKPALHLFTPCCRPFICTGLRTGGASRQRHTGYLLTPLPAPMI